MTPSTVLSQQLLSYRHHIEEKIRESIPHLGQKTALRDACEYALLNGGKRFRPAIVMMVAEALNLGCQATEAALAVEYFHCASLIADDLPCMDNDDMRRDKPSLHKVYGESVALLTTYALIAKGYDFLAINAQSLEEGNHVLGYALINTVKNTGIHGATGGQFLDLFPPDQSEQSLSFTLGWLYGGGDVARLPQVTATATHFGMAFQIADDLQDIAQDTQNNRVVNLATCCGKVTAFERLKDELTQYRKLLVELNIATESLLGLADLISETMSDNSER
jgi:geranylgeranyl diphosphate synthase type II